MELISILYCIGVVTFFFVIFYFINRLGNESIKKSQQAKVVNISKILPLKKFAQNISENWQKSLKN